jgi:hypothetical protein
MDIWSLDRVVLVIGFVIPGFVALKTYEAIFPSVPRESAKQIIDAIAYSCINYALLLLPIIAIEKAKISETSPGEYLAFYIFVLLIAPVLWALLFALGRKTKLVQGLLPHPTEKPWDFVFAQRKPYWVIVTLNDGTKIAGRYGLESFASSSPAPAQLYLEEAWQYTNDGFERQRTDTAGILILSPDIVSVEFALIKEQHR